MARLHRTSRANRAGFTLVELLVAVSLIIVLLSLAVVFGPRYTNSQRVISAADRTSGWLLIAKQQAFRDNAPRGVRFIQNGTTGLWTEAQYIEAPEAYIPNPAQEANPTGGRIVFAYQLDTAGTAVKTRQVYFVVTGATAASDLSEFDQRVTAGDRLVLPEFGMSYQLTAAPSVPTGSPLVMIAVAGGPQAAVPATNCRLLTLQSTPDLTASGSGTTTVPGGFQGTLTTYKFGFQGAPRPVVGEPVLQLASGTLIDFPTVSPPAATTTLGVTAQSDGVTTFFDILFSPSGQVLNNSAGLICLWVRGYEADRPFNNPRFDPTNATTPYDGILQFETVGEQSLVAVSTRSGLISTQPVNSPPGAPTATPSPTYDPYKFAKDGQNSGL